MARKKKQTSKEALLAEILGGTPLKKTSKRTMHVTTRLSEDTVEAIDAMIALEVFSSRSDAVASYVEHSIHSRNEMYYRLIQKAKEVTTIRNSARYSILDSIQEEQEKRT